MDTKRRTWWDLGEFSSCSFQINLGHCGPLTSSIHFIPLKNCASLSGSIRMEKTTRQLKSPTTNCSDSCLNSQHWASSLLTCLEVYSLLLFPLASMFTSSRMPVFSIPSSSAADLHLLSANDAQPLGGFCLKMQPAISECPRGILPSCLSLGVLWL